MRNVLVTGGAGFLGSHLVRAMLDRGCGVTVADDLSTGVRGNLDPRAEFVRHDVSLPMPEFLIHQAFDTIFHLAAVSRIQQSWVDPERCYDVNQTGTDNVLALARRRGAAVVFASTSCCQGDCALNPYAKSKRYGERLCNEYRQGFGLRVAVARLFNVYGPGEYGVGPAATLVGRFLHAHRTHTPFTINGDGYQRRDFVHVADAVDALIRLATTPAALADPDPFDVGTGFTHSVREVATLFTGLPPNQFTRTPGERYKGELESTRANPERLFALGWCPGHRLEDYVRGVL